MNRRALRKRVVCVIAAGAAIGTLAYAGPIRFDNPTGAGHFDWMPQVVGDQIFLNVLVDANAQTPGSGASGAFKQRALDPSGTDVRRGGPTGEGPQFVLNPQGNTFYLFPVDAGSMIPTPGAGGFSSAAVTYWTGGPEYLFDGQPTLFTAGVEAYIGVRFGTGPQYGWVGVVPEWATFTIGGTPTNALVLDAFAWGYETEVGVPIAAGAPEPGTLAMLALGAVTALRPRRLRSQID